MKLELVGLLIAFWATGCGTDFTPEPLQTQGKTAAQLQAELPLVQIQLVNTIPDLIPNADLQQELEDCNHQFSHEFITHWGVNCEYVWTLPQNLDTSKPSMQAVNHFPNPLKDLDPNVAGYHQGNTGYFKFISGFNYRVTVSHEGMELACDESVASLAGLLRQFFFDIGVGQAPTEICDPVEADGYAVSPGGPIACSDFCFPDYFGIGNVTLTGSGQPQYDYLLRLTGPSPQVAPGGSPARKAPTGGGTPTP